MWIEDFLDPQGQLVYILETHPKSDPVLLDAAGHPVLNVQTEGVRNNVKREAHFSNVASGNESSTIAMLNDGRCNYSLKCNGKTVARAAWEPRTLRADVLNLRVNAGVDQALVRLSPMEILSLQIGSHAELTTIRL